jgi:hypothetical protein
MPKALNSNPRTAIPKKKGEQKTFFLLGGWYLYIVFLFLYFYIYIFLKYKYQVQGPKFKH